MKDSTIIITASSSVVLATALVVVLLATLKGKRCASGKRDKRSRDIHTKYKVAASITTIPSRINKECKLALQSLIDQKHINLEKIYLVVSHHYKRFGDLDPLPDYLQQEPFKSKVQVVYYDDVGSPSKYLGALEHVSQDTWLFVGDDDQEYHPTLISRMLHNVKKPGLYQNRYENIKELTSGGYVHGFVGNLTHRSALNRLIHFPIPECARRADDQWMSIYCMKNRIPVFKSGIEDFSDIFKTTEDGHEKQTAADALSDLGDRAELVRKLEEFFKVKLYKTYY
jgi:hypothetical protein